MIKAISGALSLALMILVLQTMLPDVATILVEIIMKVLIIINTILDQAGNVPQIQENLQVFSGREIEIP